MSSEATMLERCGSKCELCGSDNPLTAYAVPPHSHVTVDTAIMVCDKCLGEIDELKTSTTGAALTTACGAK